MLIIVILSCAPSPRQNVMGTILKGRAELRVVLESVAAGSQTVNAAASATTSQQQQLQYFARCEHLQKQGYMFCMVSSVDMTVVVD